MRQLLVVGSLVGALALAAPTGAGERSWYVGIEGGIEFDGDGDAYGTSYDNGWAALLTVGRGISSHINLEGELGFRITDSSGYFGTWEVDQLSVMFNAVYEAALTEDISLAIGAGFGGNHVEYEYFGGYTVSDTKAAAQLKLGLALDISEGTELVANYRFMETFDSSADNSTLTVGLRFDL